MTYLRPGVYVEEISTKTAPLTGSAATSIAAFVGVTDKGPTTATLVNSWAQYTSLYGSWGINNTVTTAVYLFFANGGNQAYIQRVVGANAATASLNIKDGANIGIATQTPSGSTNITITTGTAHGLSVGQQVVISGVTPSGYNGTWTTQTGTTGSTLVVNIGSNPGAITVAGAVAPLTLQLSAANAGVWGNSMYVSTSASALGSDYFTVTVYSGGNSEAYVVERFTDVTMNTTDARYAINVINGGSTYITAKDLAAAATYSSTVNPVVTAVTALANGSNGTAPTTANIASAVSGGALDSIENALLLNAPGLTAQADVDVLLAYAAGRKDVFVVIDGINDTAANQITLVNTYATANAGYGAVYFPQLVIPNPNQVSTGAIVTVPAGAAVIGRIVTTDASRGVFKSPAGLDARLSGVVSVNKLTNTELDNLNSNTAAINAIRYIPGSGIVVMGARTLKPGYADRYVSVRRSLIYLRKQADDLTKFGLFEPNDFRLWARIESTLQAFLTDFWQQGGLAGNSPSDAFFVKCDEENNTDLTVANGQVIAEIGVALQRPAEFIVIRISQYDGGSVVTIS
jgi:phage tail sheath protein FI